mgnify:CR=1 FL=1
MKKYIKITLKKLNYKKNKKNKRKTKKRCKKRICFKNKPKNFIFGYGSIINIDSMKHTGKKYVGNPIPVELSKKAGFQRIWVCKKSKYGKYSFLGLIKNRKKAHNINGVITPVYKCIKNFDKREKGYKRIKIKYDPKKKNMIKALSWQNLPNYPCNIYIYLNNEEITYPKKDCPISQNYLDTILIGCLDYGEDYVKKFIKNTYGWSNKKGEVFWVNDRKITKRKWIKGCTVKKKNFIDKLLKKYIPNYYKFRKN